ncbi:MAG TPA: hypothetical protein EYQ58_04055, partial [Candidatus Poseidoniales archaeon]|nr:hypothetical protein [Candidatus Poseidoniales archaeon]
MSKQRTSAVILIFVMLSAGCFGAADEIVKEEIKPEIKELSLNVQFVELPVNAMLGEIVNLQITVQSQGEGDWVATVSIYPEVEFAMTQTEDIVHIIFMPSEVVSYTVAATFQAANTETTIIDSP